jgi:hypothetical protein
MYDSFFFCLLFAAVFVFIYIFVWWFLSSITDHQASVYEVPNDPLFFLLTFLPGLSTEGGGLIYRRDVSICQV